MERHSPTTARQPCFAVRLCAELKRLVVLAVVVGLVAVAGKYYCFDRLDEEIRVRVESLLRNHYQGLAVSVKSARRVAGKGVEIRGVRIAEAGGKDAPVLVQIDEIFADCDTRLPDFLTKPLQITELRVQRLKLRAERKGAGLWNLSHLLPLPPSQGTLPPVARITDAALEIVDPTQGEACSWVLRNIELTVQPENSQPVAPSGREGEAPAEPRLSGSFALPFDTAAAKVLHVRGTLAGDHLDRIEIDGLLDPVSGAWSVRGAVEGLEFSPRLRAALPRELVAALAPLSSIRGRTYFGFEAHRAGRESIPLPMGEGGPRSGPGEGFQSVDARAPTTLTPALSQRERETTVQFSIAGKISDGRIDDARLPEPLTDVEATIRCDNAGVQIENLSARCGQATIELSASLAGYSAASPIEMALTARHVQLDRLPIANLPPQVGETWARFSPRGLVDISGRLQFDGRQWRPDLTIQCHDLSLLYDRFPYRVTDGSGTIRVLPDFVRVRLRTIGGGRPVHCRADVYRPGRSFTGWIEVESEGPAPIDERLLAALDDPTEAFVRSLRPRGSASFAARFERQPGETAVHRRIAIQLHDCSVQYEKFPYPIDRIGGQLALTDNVWEFRNLTGRNDSAVIAGAGSWVDTGPGGKQLVLQFTARDVPLADELRQALPPVSQRLWTNLRPRGNIDQLLVGVRYGSLSRLCSIDVQGEKWPQPDAATGRAISLEPAWFLYRLDNLTGSFHYRDGLMQFQNLHAVHGRAGMTAEGTCRVLPEGGCRLELTRLTADRVEADQDLVAALPPGLGHVLGRFPLEGPLNLLGAVGLTVPQGDAPPQLDWDLSLDVENGRLLTPTPLEHLHGGMRLIGRQSGDGVYCRGEVQIDSAIFRGAQLTEIAGPFWLDGQRLVFGALAERDVHSGPPRQVTARVFGGTLALGGELSLDTDGRFQVQALLDRADLAEIARELAPHQRGLSGNVFGIANLVGSSQGMHTWRGSGQIRLTEADIYRLPVMISLLKLLSVQPPDRTAFTTSSIDFRIEGDDLVFSRVDFSGDAISLKGTGRMNAQRQIDLKFYPIFGREEWHWPIFRPLVGETGREFLLIEVTGTLDRLEVRRTPFPRIDAQLQQLFPELAREGRAAPTMPILSLPREALDRLRQPLRR